MRGTLVPAGVADKVAGIIPADAGNTCRRPKIVRDCKDHPRGCGEHIQADCAKLRQDGSSPRMRGTLDGIVNHRPEHGIIPADAGNTTICAYRQNRSQDHPRGCGEHNQYYG